jgi:hypothetical protein
MTGWTINGQKKLKRSSAFLAVDGREPVCEDGRSFSRRAGQVDTQTQYRLEGVTRLVVALHQICCN